MKFSLLALVFLAGGCRAHPDYSETWEEFKGKYGKEYANDMEEVYKYAPSILLFKPIKTFRQQGGTTGLQM